MDKLTEKQKRFIDYYIETGNATDSARRAGYKQPHVQGTQNLEKLSKYIQPRLEKMSSRRIADANEVLEYLTKVLRGEEKDQFGLDAALKDRNKAAELLGKRYKLFIERIEQENKGDIQVVFNVPRPKKEKLNENTD
jgi:phage terminase small subunit